MFNKMLLLIVTFASFSALATEFSASADAQWHNLSTPAQHETVWQQLYYWNFDSISPYAGVALQKASQTQQDNYQTKGIVGTQWQFAPSINVYAEYGVEGAAQPLLQPSLNSLPSHHFAIGFSATF